MRNKFVIQVFYTNINLNSAGTEKFINNQIVELNNQDIDAIILFPVRKIIFGVSLDYWGIMLNGKNLQILNTDEIVKELSIMSTENKQLIGVMIHHLQNVNISKLQKILSSIRKCPILFYLHDFYTACVQYNLLRNDLKFCGSAEIEKEKCSNCRYYISSIESKERLRNLFSTIENDYLFFIAPSNYVLNTWIKAYPEYVEKIHVIGHLEFRGEYSLNKELLNDNDQLNIAYVGASRYTKGWTYWLDAVNAIDLSFHNYHLYKFGNKEPVSNKMTIVPVSIQKDGADAMINALRKNNIHVAVLNSICPETYSYTFYECLASNVFIITNKDSGNIQAQVRAFQNGIVLDSPIELSDILENELKLRSLINDYQMSTHKIPAYYASNNHYFDYLLATSSLWFSAKEKSRVPIFRVGCFFVTILYNIRYWNKKQFASFLFHHIVK